MRGALLADCDHEVNGVALFEDRNPMIIRAFVHLLGHAPVCSALRLLAKDEAAWP